MIGISKNDKGKNIWSENICYMTQNTYNFQIPSDMLVHMESSYTPILDISMSLVIWKQHTYPVAKWFLAKKNRMTFEALNGNSRQLAYLLSLWDNGRGVPAPSSMN